MTEKYLALDLGTTTGWASVIRRPKGGTLRASGSISFKPNRFEGGGMRFLRMQRWLEEMNKLVGPLTWVCFEEVRNHAGVDAAHIYGGFLASLGAWCESHQIPYQGVPVGTIKKHATGKGNASKEDMLITARNRGYSPADDNEADALALAHWMMDHGTADAPSERPAPDRKARRRIPLEPVPLARRPVRRREG